MKHHYLFRIGFGVILLGGIYIFPYWLVIFIAGVATLFIPHYFEFVLLVVFEEALYHTTGESPSSVLVPVVLLSLYIVVELSRSIIRERILRI